jgi:5-methyltetrahydropteroyltriglutamate--homocysteine methyltransferase
MQPRPLRTTVIGSYPLPGWLELASEQLERFGPDDVRELQEDAVIVAVHDQLAAGLDVISDGEQTRLDFNLSFYGYLEGIQRQQAPTRRFGPPAHDQRGRHRVVAPLSAPRGLGVVEEFRRLRRVAPPGVCLKMSVPGPYTLSGRLEPGEVYADRYAVAEALVPIVRQELLALLREGCTELAIDEPSMSCYAYREDRSRLVDIFNRTVDGVYGSCRLSTHLCFGNYKARAVAPRRYAPMLPEFLSLHVDEIHLEMANREFAEIELLARFAEHFDVAVGIIDVKNSYIETPEDVAERTRRCLAYVPAERLALAPDCGLSQTARWAARLKLQHLVAGVRQVRRQLGLHE